MNQISSEQWTQLGRDSFDARLIAIIRRHHPDQAAKMDFAAVVGAFHRQAAKAQRYATIDFAESFPRMLGLTPARGTTLAMDFGRTVPAF